MSGRSEENLQSSRQYGRLAALFFLLPFAGCSTFQVSDSYPVTGELPGFMNDKGAGVELRVGIDPDLRFTSVGLLGAPILPVYFKPTQRKEITLELEVVLHKDQDFSFASRPCLKITNSSALCPVALEAFAVALFQDAGSDQKDRKTRWHHL